jgi:putative transposase
MPNIETDYELAANKVRLYPNQLTEQWFLLNMSHARFVYNFFLQVQMEWYKCIEPEKAKQAKKFEIARKPRKLTKQQKLTRERNQKAIAKLIRLYKCTGKRSMSCFDMCKLLVLLKNMKDFEWLYSANAQVLQQTLMDLSLAFKNFYRGKGKVGFPRYHKRNRKDRFKFPADCRLDVFREGVQLPGVPTVDRYVPVRGIRRDLLMTHKTIQSVTVSLDAGKWYGSILARVPIKTTKFDFPHEICGVDVGVVNPTTASYGDGSYEVFGKEFSERLKLKELKAVQYQKKLARRKLGSKNYQKSKVQLQRAYQKVRFARQDFVEQTSHRLAQCRIVCMEDTQIKNMVRSAKGTVDNPGCNVAAKSALNRQLARLGLGAVYTRTMQKLTRRGGKFIPVPAHHTSQGCSVCGYVNKGNRKSQAIFKCLNPKCGHTANADDNASDCMIGLGQGTLVLWTDKKWSKSKLNNSPTDRRVAPAKLLPHGSVRRNPVRR